MIHACQFYSHKQHQIEHYDMYLMEDAMMKRQ